MKKQILPSLLALSLLAILAVTPASAGTKEQLIQLQTTVQILQDNMAKMQQSFDERMGVIRDLITQQTDNVNKMTNTIQGLQKSLQQQSSDSSGKVDSVQGQIQSLHDSVDELKARMQKVSKQLDDIRAAQQSVPAATSPAAAQPPQNQAPPADQLYGSALSDFNGGSGRQQGPRGPAQERLRPAGIGSARRGREGASQPDRTLSKKPRGPAGQRTTQPTGSRRRGSPR